MLLAVQQLEEALLAPPTESGGKGSCWSVRIAEQASPYGAAVSAPSPFTWLPFVFQWLTSLHGTSPLLLQLLATQQWRWSLLRALHGDPESSQPQALSLHYEALLFAWMRLRKASAALLAAVPSGLGASSPPWAEACQRWTAAAGQLDGAAGIAGGCAPPKPLLWKLGGRPLLPRTLELSEAYAQLLALCDASRWEVGVGRVGGWVGRGRVGGVEQCNVLSVR